ncbi:restriction endonuclease subunit S [Sphingomonas bacterium]|uniref:restriction endonuclease subunit S n=1 Tax=Sphingomonas bacterium TaxID=1895847 RepID=UPI0020C71870|nr:restriction endonuclease subunit S [Sphingomonas bacterium]
MGEWSTVKLDDVASLGGGFAFKSSQYTSSGRFVLRTVNITDDYAITREGSAFISEDDAQEYGRFSLRENDTLFVMVAATLGKVGLVRKKDLPALLNQNMWVIRAREGQIDPTYLHYVFRELSKIPLAWVGGSARGFLRRDDVRNLPFALPPMELQTRIAELLCALDDKIDLNRRMNETLEASARALFRDWFVDFAPTRAKAEGRPAHFAPDFWSLFPDQLGDDGVPEGWSETPLDQIADFLNGLALQKFPPAPDEASLPVIKIGELRSGVSASSNRASTNVPTKYIVGDGDFLFSWSGSLLAKFWTEGAGALNQHLFKVTSDTFPAWLFSHWVWHHLAEFQAIAASKATTMGHIQRGHLSAATTITPSPATLAKMSEFMQPLLDQIIGNLLECRTLATTRDALLPKLMSGELRVRDAEALAA